MSKPKPHAVTENDTSPAWQQTHGTYLAGRAAIDGADALAREVEQRWGAGRVRLLVPTELREKFDRQRYLFDKAILHGDLEEVRQQSARMERAWRAVDAAATDAGKKVLAPEVWETVLENGRVAAIVRTNDDARHVVAEGRGVSVWTLEEIARLLSAWPTIAAAKEHFQGATVAAIYDRGDPLASHLLDDDLPF